MGASGTGGIRAFLVLFSARSVISKKALRWCLVVVRSNEGISAALAFTDQAVASKIGLGCFV